MEKINWNEKRDEIVQDMNPNPLWERGTDAQQEFADELVDRFCKKFAKYLCCALKDNLIDDTDCFGITNTIYYAINDIDDAKWWCNKKDTDDFKIAIKLLEENEDEIELINKIKKQYS